MQNFKRFRYPGVIALFAIIFSCNQASTKPDVYTELDLLDSVQRKAHYTGDAALLGSSIADTFTQVREGKITRMTRQQLVDRFKKYFSEVRYSYWENIQPPMIIVSEDNTMAAVTYNKKAVSFSKDEEEPDTTVFAWTAIMKKTKEGWRTKQVITTQ